MFQDLVEEIVGGARFIASPPLVITGGGIFVHVSVYFFWVSLAASTLSSLFATVSRSCPGTREAGSP